MHKNNIDAFFHLASHGNKEAFNLLYEEFVGRANSVIKSVIKRNSNFKGFPEDFCDLIDELFFKAINEYEPERGRFSSFVNWLFDVRLTTAVLKKIIDIKTYVKTLDNDEDELDEIENFPDLCSLPITNQIALNNFELKISSQNNHKNQYEKRRDKILTLVYAGFTKNEICKKLKISYSSLRRFLDKIKDDEDINNIKLDLK